jgi:hypothetical protein
MPASGLVFALRAFAHAIRGIGKSEAQKVGIDGGLCMYARSNGWRPPGIVESLQASVRPRRVPEAVSSRQVSIDIVGKMLPACSTLVTNATERIFAEMG